MSSISLWWRAARPFSLTVSVIPPIIGGIVAKIDDPGLQFDWWYFFLAILGCVVSHSGANMLSDYYDFKARVDREGTFGSSGVLTERLMQPREVFAGAILAYLIATLIGLYIAFSIPNGAFLLVIILIGAILGFFYTAGPFAFKYHALGDLAVFISFGPAITLGAYFIQAHSFSWHPILFAIPIAFLVDAVLHSNNLRDIENDSVVKIRTVAILLGEKYAKLMYYGLVLGAYISLVVLIVWDGLPVILLITLLSLPLAVKLIKTVNQKDRIPLKQFIMIDVATAQLHSIFGILFMVSLLVQYFIIQ